MFFSRSTLKALDELGLGEMVRTSVLEVRRTERGLHDPACTFAAGPTSLVTIGLTSWRRCDVCDGSLGSVPAQAAVLADAWRLARPTPLAGWLLLTGLGGRLDALRRFTLATDEVEDPDLFELRQRLRAQLRADYAALCALVKTPPYELLALRWASGVAAMAKTPAESRAEVLASQHWFARRLGRSVPDPVKAAGALTPDRRESSLAARRHVSLLEDEAYYYERTDLILFEVAGDAPITLPFALRGPVGRTLVRAPSVVASTAQRLGFAVRGAVTLGRGDTPDVIEVAAALTESMPLIDALAAARRM